MIVTGDATRSSDGVVAAPMRPGSHTRGRTVRRSAFALCVALSMGAIEPAGGTAAEIAVQCEFAFGLGAVYMFSREQSRVRRADLLQPREGNVKATPDEYRFIFRERGSAYGIDVIIDRATGNARRVFGTRDNMERLPEREDRPGGLVFEAGQCQAQGANLR